MTTRTAPDAPAIAGSPGEPSCCGGKGAPSSRTGTGPEMASEAVGSPCCWKENHPADAKKSHCCG